MQQMIAILTWTVVIGFVSLGALVVLAWATTKRDLARRDQQLQERLNDLARMREILEQAWRLSRAKDAIRR